jgi:hypothetical protein
LRKKKSDGNSGNENLSKSDNPVERLSSRQDQIEDRIPELENKVDVLEQSDKEEKLIQTEHTRPLGHH